MSSFIPGNKSTSSQILSNGSTSQDSKSMGQSSSQGGGYSPEMPYNNTLSLPGSPEREKKVRECSSDRDLEGQMRSQTQSGDQYVFSNALPTLNGGKRQSLILASSGLPAFPTNTSSTPMQPAQARNQQEHFGNVNLNNGNALGGVRVQRDQVIRNEVVPSSFNFINNSNGTDEEVDEYKGLSGKKSSQDDFN